MRGFDLMLSTGLAFLERFAKKLKAGGNKLMLAGLEPGVMKQLEKTGMLEEIGKESILAETAILGESIALALAAAKDWNAASK